MLNFKTSELEAKLRLTCEQVLKRFKLPSFRLLCFFDDENPAKFDDRFGPSHCGFHTPVIGSGNGWPPYVDSLFFDSAGDFAYDNVIYINSRTSSSLPGTVITFAHELQHFMQYGYDRKVLRANTLICDMLRDRPPTTIKPWDIPSEQDATRVSKRVAEEILGREIVNAHVHAQIAEGNDPERWNFFRNLHPTAPFDLLAETKLRVQRYRTELTKVQKSEVDFTQDEWWN